MRRTTLTEKHKAVALLIALGQLSFLEIAKMVDVHRNSVTNWLKDERVQVLVGEFQEHIQSKLEDMTIESVHRKNTLLLTKAVEKLEQLLESKSQKRQLAVIKMLLEYGALPQVRHEIQDAPHEERPSLIRLDPALRSRMKVKQSERDRFPVTEHC